MSVLDRPTYEPGRYFCVRTGGWAARVIQAATLSPFNHTAVIISAGGDIIEGEPGGVRRGHISEYSGCLAVSNSFEVMDDHRSQLIVDKAASMIGVPYNDLAIAEDGIESLGAHWAWLARRAADFHGTICSQLAVICGQAAGYDWLCGKKTAPEVTPADLASRKTWIRPFTIE